MYNTFQGRNHTGKMRKEQSPEGGTRNKKPMEFI